ncbi:hypothetical protein HPB50_020001 [Hyalomma asiaticum]|uniref:Uncharacterized protein n=1 Tax=Hyalomma asiaticum TaxID=266040 RepID=A0ACB7RLX5_HYAAI|nr:hypothetical protein HPB50_020001 [Hyalomma asiaticum]
MATAPCSTDVFEHLDDAAREEAYRSAVSEAAALKTEVDQLRRELELLKMVPSKDHDAANDDDAPKPPLDPQLQASHDFLCNLLAPLIERIERLESRTRLTLSAMPPAGAAALTVMDTTQRMTLITAFRETCSTVHQPS